MAQSFENKNKNKNINCLIICADAIHYTIVLKTLDHILPEVP